MVCQTFKICTFLRVSFLALFDLFPGPNFPIPLMYLVNPFTNNSTKSIEYDKFMIIIYLNDNFWLQKYYSKIHVLFFISIVFFNLRLEYA